MGSYERVETQDETDSRPPFTIDLLVDEMRRHARLPHCVPREPLQAAKWWAGIQKPATERFERPVQVTVAGAKSAKRWLTPYADRLIVSFRRFVNLTQKEQEFVIAAFEDGVFYNGDEPEIFTRIYEETQRMLEMGAENYRAETMRRLKAMSGRIVKRRS